MKRKTHEDFIKEMKILHPTLQVCGTYINSKTYLDIYCTVCQRHYLSKPNNLLSGRGCSVCSNRENGRKRAKTQEQFVNEVIDLNKGLKAIGTYNNMHTKVQFQCAKGHIFNARPHDILHGDTSCPYCSGNKVLQGFNDLWTTRPDIAQMLDDAKMGYMVSVGSNKKLDFVCPECGTHKTKSPKEVISQGLGCQVCSDGISYPNKFARALLNQLSVTNIVYEYHPDWAQSYFYDNYFEYNGQKYILEMDGGIGHGCHTSYSQKTGDTGVERDKIKDKLAIRHNIIVIRIDCKYTNVYKGARMEYIQNSLKNSILAEMFDLDMIDYNECNIYALKSLSIKAAQLYDKGHRIVEIAQMLNVSYDTVYRWLKEMAKNNLCSYKPTVGRARTYKNIE